MPDPQDDPSTQVIDGVEYKVIGLSDDISPEEVDSQVRDVVSPVTDSGPVTGMDLLRFAKLIISAAVVVVLVIGFMYIFNEDNKAVKDVWSFTSTAANSIIALVIGYYFGTKQL